MYWVTKPKTAYFFGSFFILLKPSVLVYKCEARRSFSLLSALLSRLLCIVHETWMVHETNLKLVFLVRPLFES